MSYCNNMDKRTVCKKKKRSRNQKKKIQDGTTGSDCGVIINDNDTYEEEENLDDLSRSSGGSAADDVVDKLLDRYGFSDSDSDDDQVSLAIKRAKRSYSRYPDLICNSSVRDVSFSPKKDIVLAGTASGNISVFDYYGGGDDCQCMKPKRRFEVFTDQTRIVEFSPDGCSVFTSDTSGEVLVVDYQTGNFKHLYSPINSNLAKSNDPLYTMKILNEHVFATGADSGIVSLWDQREGKALFSAVDSITDCVTSIQHVENSHYLACTSGDGILTTFDMNKMTVIAKTCIYKSEFSCSGLFMKDTKLVVGTGIGSLLCFDWGKFDQWNDEFPAIEKKKYAITCMVPITENMVIVGMDSGCVRATHLYPMRHVGIVGQIAASINCMDISWDGRLIATSCDRNKVTLMDVEYFADIQIDDRHKSDNDQAKEFHLPSSLGLNRSDFFAGLEDQPRQEKNAGPE